MKRALIHFFALGLLLNSPLVSAQVVVTPSVIGDIKATFTSLFAAFQSGDVQTIKQYLSDAEYARNKVLLEQNKDYPAFLWNFYRGATVRIGEVQSVLSASDDVIAEFIVDFPAGDTTITRMRLSRNRGGWWTIKKYLAGKFDNGEPSGEGRR